MNCRHCHTPLEHTFLDLGFAPPSNAYLDEADLRRPEVYYPLKLKVCDQCWLVQTEDYAGANELFTPDYAYFSSTSSSWLEHARRYAEGIIKRLGLGANSFVIEIASNDGYLLKNFVLAGIPCLGIEPTASTAAAAESAGVPVLQEFFGAALGQKLATEGRRADLIVGNNVYAHVPDINDFTAGMKCVLKPGGTLTLEFPHVMRLIENTQFDTVYHEHFSYLSLHTVGRMFQQAGLRVVDVEEIPTHGGSLRVFGCHTDDLRPASSAVASLMDEEERCGLRKLATYRAFQPRADKIKNDTLAFLIEQKRQGKTVSAYGAAAKGSTLLNYAGIKADLLACAYDAAPSKQGKFMPGSHIPIVDWSRLREDRPDYVVILPWNLRQEVMAQIGYIRGWGGRFVTAIPRVEVA